MSEHNPEIRVDADTLRRLVAKKLTAAGLNSEHANKTADVLICADERGVYSHGVIRTEHYVKRILAGSLNTNPAFSYEEKRPGSGIFNADHGMGHVATSEAMDKAIAMAKNTGIAMVGIEESSHCGALAYYVQQATAQNMIGICFVQTDKCVTPFGGSRPFFGTNPVAFGFPCAQNPDLIIDMATSHVAYGKILHAREKDIAIPDDWAFDDEGRATTDPHKVGGLMPLGGYKGYAIALAIDVLTGVLLGAQFGPHINAMYADYGQQRRLAAMVIAIDPSTFIGADQFMAQMDAMVNELHAQPTAPGCDQILVAGDPELEMQEEARSQGVTVVTSLYDYLKGDTL